MACDIVECCQFFKDSMVSLPKSAEYIKNKFCLGDYESCNRYRIYRQSCGTDLPFHLNLDDVDAIMKAKQCLLEKKAPKE